PYIFATWLPPGLLYFANRESPAGLPAILQRDKHDHTSRQCREPCFSERADLSCALVAARAQGAARADRNSIACQTKCPGRLLQRGWAPQERRSLAWVTGWQASIRHDDRRSRARWNVGGDHKSSIWFSTTDGGRELVCADVALSGNHCELRKRPFWKLLASARAVIERTAGYSSWFNPVLPIGLRIAGTPQPPRGCLPRCTAFGTCHSFFSSLTPAPP